MSTSYIAIERSLCLNGTVELVGAKNAVLVIIASLLLTKGKSRLTNVPASDDVLQMIKLMQSLGAEIFFYPDEHLLEVDTSHVTKWQVSADIMKKMRASILVMGPLLARFGKADIAAPGGCVIGTRPIDYHLKNFKKMGALIEEATDYLTARADLLHAQRIVLEYPSVGATENVLMAATLTHGVTTIVNAAIEPEVLDLIAVLKKMGAKITVEAPATISIEGVISLQPIEHAIIPDRLEAGALLLAAAITGGSIYLPQAHAYSMDVFLLKLEEMGHEIIVGPQGIGITLKATKEPRAVSFKTAPYPGFPTDLQAPLLAALCVAQGTSIVEETVFENRLLHVRELQKMGAQIKVEHNKAIITGVDKLYGASVIATDIRASCALVLAGMIAEGSTIMTGIHHWTRGYDGLENKLTTLGAQVIVYTNQDDTAVIFAQSDALNVEQAPRT
jgi:UDP-N-acetylglucosamine 1-carboxyvinyltransferase